MFAELWEKRKAVILSSDCEGHKKEHCILPFIAFHLYAPYGDIEHASQENPMPVSISSAPQ